MVTRGKPARANNMGDLRSNPVLGQETCTIKEQEVGASKKSRIGNHNPAYKRSTLFYVWTCIVGVSPREVRVNQRLQGGLIPPLYLYSDLSYSIDRDQSGR